MATKQRTSARKPASSKKKGSSSASRKRSTSSTGRSRSATSSRSTAARTGPSPLRQLFDGHGHDVWGLVLIVLAVLSGLGVYGFAGGPVGSGLAAGIAGLVGRLDVLVPPALVVGGVLLIRGPRGSRPSTSPRRPRRTSSPGPSCGTRPSCGPWVRGSPCWW